MDVRMDGRVAVITGSSTGLGLAMAKEFAASGGSVALLARKADALATAKAEVQKAAGKSNGRFEAYSCDVSKAAADRRDLEEGRGRLRQGRHPGEQRRHQPRQGVRDGDRRGLAGRSRPQAVRRHPPLPLALPGMKQRKWGRIVNVLNIGAKAPGADSTPTSVSRAAGLALTKAMSKENAQHNVWSTPCWSA
jgi:NAD(P)-dependent dehydrogenase (short-subunit alcohol dehydrogenase family)